MFRFKIIFCIAVILPLSWSTAYADERWQLVSPRPVDIDSYLTGVSFPSDSVGYVIGSGDQIFILKTTDRGTTWATSLLPTFGLGYTRATAVDFIDPLHGCVVGGGYVAVTNDGGKTWRQGNAGTTTPALNDVKFVTRAKGWAVGDGNTIIATTDSGLTWTSQSTTLTADNFNRVSFVDQNTGWTIGSLTGTVFKTTNGGTTWLPVYTFPWSFGGNSHGVSVYFISANEGWAGVWAPDAGDAIYHTTTGGQAWVPQYVGAVSNSPMFDIAFATPLLGWAVGQGKLLQTVDGGTNWTTMTHNLPSSSYNFTVVAVSPSQVYTVTDGECFILKAARADNQYTMVNSTKTGSFSRLYFTSIGFADTTTGYIVEYYGVNNPIFRTTDAGQTWTDEETIAAIDKPVDTHLTSLAVVTPEQVWATGAVDDNPATGFILRRLDSLGSVAWEMQDAGGITSPLQNIFFFDTLRGFVVGDNAVILRTTNGGSQWDIVANGADSDGTQPSYSKIIFSDRATGWILDNNGKLLSSRDSGKIWQQLDDTIIPPEDHISDVFFLDSLHGWAAGTPQSNYIGFIYYTSDKGVTWTKHDSVTTEYGIYTIVFTDTLHGWGFDGRPHIIGTSDGGVTWQLAETDFVGTPGFRSMIFSEGHGWVCGSASSILRYRGKANGVGSGDLLPSADSVVYPPVQVGSTRDTTLQIKNIGTGSLSVTNMFFRSGTTHKFLSPIAPFGLSPGADSVVHVRFAPLTRGEYRDTLIVEHTGIISPKKVFVVGRGVQGEIGSLPAVINFKRRAVGSVSDTTFVLKNTGDGMLQVTALSFRQGTYYQTLSPALPFQLSPGADSIVRTRYKPTTRGWHRDTLAIGSDGILSPRLVEFTGTDSIIIGVRESDSPREEIVVQNFPNPFSSKTIISFSGEAGLAGGTLEISDVLGRTLYSSLIEKGQRQLTIDASRLPAGMYMYSLKTERSIFGGMMTVVK